ncbi:MAG: hypothetical protein ACI87E_002728 [Mariniblastus sp.]|jgi:hypothetical protein
MGNQKLTGATHSPVSEQRSYISTNQRLLQFRMADESAFSSQYEFVGTPIREFRSAPPRQRKSEKRSLPSRPSKLQLQKCHLAADPLWKIVLGGLATIAFLAVVFVPCFMMLSHLTLQIESHGDIVWFDQFQRLF